MTKFLISVEIAVHGIDTAITAEDTATSSAGSNALYAIEHHNDVIVPGDGSYTLIPYHQIVAVTVTKTTSTVEDPEDANCVTRTPADETQGG